MNYKLLTTPTFVKSVKKLQKKYKLIKDDLKLLREELSSGDFKAIDLGHGCYKLRLPNSSIPTGKSGGFRVIFFVRIEAKIYLLDIYSKTDVETISDEKLVQILKDNEL